MFKVCDVHLKMGNFFQDIEFPFDCARFQLNSFGHFFSKFASTSLVDVSYYFYQRISFSFFELRKCPRFALIHFNLFYFPLRFKTLSPEFHTSLHNVVAFNTSIVRKIRTTISFAFDKYICINTVTPHITNLNPRKPSNNTYLDGLNLLSLCISIFYLLNIFMINSNCIK